jgi:hypothetical protein
MSELTATLSRVNSVAIVMLIAWMGILSSFIWERPPLLAPQQQEMQHHVTGVYSFSPLGVTQARYPSNGATISECDSVKWFTLCCELADRVHCALPCEMIKSGLFEYYAVINVSQIYSGVECRIYCRKF